MQGLGQIGLTCDYFKASFQLSINTKPMSSKRVWQSRTSSNLPELGAPKGFEHIKSKGQEGMTCKGCLRLGGLVASQRDRGQMNGCRHGLYVLSNGFVGLDCREDRELPYVASIRGPPIG